MKKIILIVVALIMLVSCEPQYKSEEVTPCSNPSYKVEKLFTVDSITVYRFIDNGRYIYFTDCTGNVEYTYRRRTGKTTTTERVQMICNEH